jgi:hypothetical protein
MSLVDIGVNALITGLTVFLSGYVMFKIAKNNVKEEIFEFLGSEEGQKLIYGLGALAAQGAKAGFGLNQRGGKFGFKEMIIGVAGKWLERSGLLGAQEEQPQFQPPARRINKESPLPS